MDSEVWTNARQGQRPPQQTHFRREHFGNRCLRFAKCCLDTDFQRQHFWTKCVSSRGAAPTPGTKRLVSEVRPNARQGQMPQDSEVVYNARQRHRPSDSEVWSNGKQRQRSVTADNSSLGHSNAKCDPMLRNHRSARRVKFHRTLGLWVLKYNRIPSKAKGARIVRYGPMPGKRWRLRHCGSLPLAP